METVVAKHPGITGALERLARYFAGARTRPGVLARQALGRPAPDDDAVRDRLVRELRAETRMDGSVGGAFVPTVVRALELMDLGHRGDDAGTTRVIGWVLKQQGRPGAFGEGCSPSRHEQRICEHFMRGFFSAAPPSARVAPLTLPNGKVFRSEAAARFVASCLALRAVLCAGQEARPLVDQHVASLVSLAGGWSDWTGVFAPDTIVSGLKALAVAPPPHRAALPALAAAVASNQADDGTWPNADLFHTLEALLMAGTPEAQAAVSRAVPALLARQRSDGSFSATAAAERALIGVRALVWAGDG